LSGLANITLVVINYNSAGVIENCLTPIDDAVKVIVIDNASTDDSIERVRRIRPDAEIILNDKNVGMGSAANQGFARVKTNYAMLLNPDAILPSQALEKLFNTAEAAGGKAGIVAPILYSPKRGLELELQGPTERMQTRTDIVPEGDFCTWFATGAAYLCDMVIWRDVGGFDENIFLYGEDTDLCRRMIEKDYLIMFAFEARGKHLVSQATTSTSRIRWRKEWNIVWSYLYLMKKYENTQTARSNAWRLFRKHGPKVLFYALVLQPKRFMRDLAVSHAALSFMMGAIPKRGS
jgi:GT2 family glycosyltransferase